MARDHYLRGLARDRPAPLHAGARVTGARTIVEFGTSFGISTHPPGGRAARQRRRQARRQRARADQGGAGARQPRRGRARRARRDPRGRRAGDAGARPARRRSTWCSSTAPRCSTRRSSRSSSLASRRARSSSPTTPTTAPSTWRTCAAGGGYVSVPFASDVELSMRDPRLNRGSAGQAPSHRREGRTSATCAMPTRRRGHDGHPVGRFGPAARREAADIERGRRVGSASSCAASPPDGGSTRPAVGASSRTSARRLPRPGCARTAAPARAAGSADRGAAGLSAARATVAGVSTRSASRRYGGQAASELGQERGSASGAPRRSAGGCGPLGQGLHDHAPRALTWEPVDVGARADRLDVDLGEVPRLGVGRNGRRPVTSWKSRIPQV